MTTLFPLSSIPGSVETLLRASITGIKKPGKILPDKGYTLSGISADKSQLEAFCKMFGFSTAHVPSTYWHIRLFSVRILLASHPDAPFPLPGMVHLSDSIRQFDTIYPDDQLDVSCRFGKLLAHEKGTAFETLTELRRGNQLVWQENAVNLYLGKKDLANDPVSSPALDIEQVDHQASWQLPEQLGLKYARVSGDFNPIHLHAIGARLFGFPKHLIHGWYGLNRSIAPFQDRMAVPHELYVSFKKPLFLPGNVVAEAEIKDEKIIFEAKNAEEGYPHLKGFLKKI
jgi:hypothetical protein